MKRLIVHGNADLRKDGIINYDGKEQRAFSVSRNGEWHGPEDVQLWCIIGTEDEREAYVTRDFVPHFLDVESIDAEDLDVVQSKGNLAV